MKRYSASTIRKNIIGACILLGIDMIVILIGAIIDAFVVEVVAEVILFLINLYLVMVLYYRIYKPNLELQKLVEEYMNSQYLEKSSIEDKDLIDEVKKNYFVIRCDGNETKECRDSYEKCRN